MVYNLILTLPITVVVYNMNSELILILSNALTGVAAFFVGKRRTNAETDSVVLKNLELSVNLYAQIIRDLKTEIESLNIKIQELEQKIDVLHDENRKLKSKKNSL
jgi:peptidoglycan hydrolase CwlO-like protein